MKVRHKIWQRLRLAMPRTKTRVEMFDLLKAALRSRPRYIIIGEIRGVEGATAFQAMQTGHPVIATFHASSIVKMIQRFTGDPINVLIRFFDNLNFAIFQEVVEAPGGGIARRITGIDEVIGYNKHSDGVYPWHVRMGPCQRQALLPWYVPIPLAGKQNRRHGRVCKQA